MGKPKRISVSSKRQITIPKEFYEDLKIGEEVLCQVVDGALVIKPVQEEVDFSEFILRDLINEGYQGEELLREFTHRKSQINPALGQMIAESRDHIVYSNTDDFFDELNGEAEDE
ncbi:AbrB/MazE/SpoVT family DNA-binding domain-containing protein [Neobacillus sp. SM06]|uniref:AbrB/MazE/SpoVT family DNA-binding domain-containing protein n=1 Tax=Neobacillus sp. SM06 TaxID=3422492 RepID=UPI003D2CCEF2